MNRHKTIALIATTITAAVLMSCNLETFLNQTATFGAPGSSGTAGAPLSSGLRGTFSVNFENNTPFRAIFTTGVFDNTDERTTPVFFQFSPDTQIQAINSTATLEGDSSSGLITFPCGRVFSVGSRSLISLVATNPGTFAPVIDEPALLDGVGFSDAALTSPAAADPNEGFAGGFEALLGVDFNCGSVINARLEFADVGINRFQVELDVIPARGDS